MLSLSVTVFSPTPRPAQRRTHHPRLLADSQPTFPAEWSALVTSSFHGPSHTSAASLRGGSRQRQLPVQGPTAHPALMSVSQAQLATALAPTDTRYPAIVTLYAPSLSMECEVDQSTRRCLSYCPIYGAFARGGGPCCLSRRPRPPPTPAPPPTRPSPAETPFENLSLDGYEDIGPVLWPNNTLAELWRQSFPPQPEWPVITSSLFVNQQVRSSAILYLNSVAIEPLGVRLATINTTYTNWTAGAVPASAFAVQGMEKCPMACIDDWVTAEGAVADTVRLRLAAATNRRSVFRRLLAALAPPAAAAAAPAA